MKLVISQRGAGGGPRPNGRARGLFDYQVIDQQFPALYALLDGRELRFRKRTLKRQLNISGEEASSLIEDMLAQSIIKQYDTPKGGKMYRFVGWNGADSCS